jgi:hypothetical protein
MALYIPHSIFHLARLLYVRPETFGPYCVSFITSSTQTPLLVSAFSPLLVSLVNNYYNLVYKLYLNYIFDCLPVIGIFATVKHSNTPSETKCY